MKTTLIVLAACAIAVLPGVARAQTYIDAPVILLPTSTTPSKGSLVVKSADRARNIFELGEKTNGDGELSIRNSAGRQIAVLGSDTAAHYGRIAVLANGSITAELSAAGDTFFNGGNVGIGTATPQAQLDVERRFKVGSLRIERSGIDGMAAEKIYTDINVNDTHLILGAKSRNDLVIRRETGNVGIGTTSPQVKLDVAGQVNCQVLQLTSDRNVKSGFTPVEPRELLQKLARLPITVWHYTNAPGIRHIGPMAQDFQAAFAVGLDDKHIATVDADGVLFAALQGLNQKLEEALKEKDAEIAALKIELSMVKQDFVARVTALETLMAQTDSILKPTADSARPVLVSAKGLADAR